MDGAARYSRTSATDAPGLSPRGRGSPGRNCRSRSLRGSIPAWTGQPCRPPRMRCWTTVYPRVDGAAAGGVRLRVRIVGLSPRGRGSHTRNYTTAIRGRSIPAWTGQPPRRTAGRRPARVYPRVDGAAVSAAGRESYQCGLSPRGRGSPPAPSVDDWATRSIPAWTGQPRRRG